MNYRNSVIKAALASVLAAWLWNCAGSSALAQTQSANPPAFSPELQEVVRLAQHHIGDDVIINYVKASGKTYRLSADDIINLNNQGVSPSVIAALQTVPAATPAASSAAAATALPLEPPPLDDSPAAPFTPPTVVSSQPITPAGTLQETFFLDTSLNPYVWQTNSPLLVQLASMYSSRVFPVLTFSQNGMQMSGTAARGQFTGIQSVESFAAPFNFSVRVTGLAQSSIPFEIYLVSADLKQRLTITGHLGGRGDPAAEIGFSASVRSSDGGFRIGTSAGYGLWLNHTGSGIPISALGSRFFDNPVTGLPYAFQVFAGPDGMASVSVLDSTSRVLASQNVFIGTGSFYVVLAGRNASAVANWQSVQLTSAASPVPVVEQPLVPQTPTLDYFQSQLTSYGNWINLPGYGYCWQPAVDSGWRPYYDGGHWEYTDAGWYWQSDYSWGDIAFHYGRWAFTAGGWVWVPGYDYAPAWVVWCHADADGYVGWAALPPGAAFVNGVWEFNHARVGVDFNFGLSLNFFTFVGYDHFWEHDFRHYVVPRDRLALAYRHSVIENHFRLDHGHVVNDGLARDRLATLTHREIKVEAAHDLRDREEHRNVLVRRDDGHNFKAGAKPDARRFAEARPAENFRAAPTHQNAPDKSHDGGPGNHSQSGKPSGGGKNENGDSRYKPDHP